MIELSVPSNWDPNLPELLGDIEEVADLYGVEGDSPYAGGRPKFMLPSTGFRRMVSFIEDVHERGWTFTYLMNSPVFGGREYYGDFRKSLDRKLGKLVDAGVDFITVANPLLADMISRSAPSIGIKVSVVAAVSSLQELELWKRHGVREITLDVGINRDFKLLEKFVCEKNVHIRLLLNDRCLYRCPYKIYHYNLMGETRVADTTLFNYCNYLCSDIFLRDPSQFLRMPAIRPEDLHIYEELGFRRFKLSGRTYPSAWIKTVTGAYAARMFDGNFLDLIDTDFNSNKQESEDAVRFGKMLTLLRRIPPFFLKLMFISVSRIPALFWGDRVEKKNLIRVLANSPSESYRDFFRWLETYLDAPGFVYMDNRAMDGFVEFFRKHSCDLDCNECGYCAGKVEGIVKLGDREKIEAFLKATSLLKERLVAGDYFVPGQKRKSGGE
jgi:collagenase-like PrtC family protease